MKSSFREIEYRLKNKRNFHDCLRALARIVLHLSYSDLPKIAKLKSSQGIFEWFITCLLDQSVNPTILTQTVERLRKSGLLDYEPLENSLSVDPTKLEHDLREALKSYRYHNRATKAILVNLEKINREYEGNLHNILHFSKDTSEVWERVNKFYWFGVKKSALFIMNLVNLGVWSLSVEEIPIPPDSRVRRVLFRLGLVKDRNDLKEVEQAARELSKKAKISCLDLDCVLWTVGNGSICGERKPSCEKCPLEDYCPNAKKDVLV